MLCVDFPNKLSRSCERIGVCHSGRGGEVPSDPEGENQDIMCQFLSEPEENNEPRCAHLLRQRPVTVLQIIKIRARGGGVRSLNYKTKNPFRNFLRILFKQSNLGHYIVIYLL